MDNNQLLSKSITALRIPLACLIVLGHANPIKFNPVIHGEIVDFPYAIIQHPVTFFSWILFAPAVPLFFCISGYLFFCKVDNFDRAAYKDKLQKRFRTLLVPYLAWNIIFLIPILLKNIFDRDLFHGVANIFGIWMVPGHYRFVLQGSMTTPVDGPLWFMRDLIVTMILSPLIYWIVKSRWGNVIFIGGLFIWYIGFGYQYWLPGLSVPALLFFTIGAYLGIHRINVLDVIRGDVANLFICFWLLLSLFDLFTIEYSELNGFSRTIISLPYLHQAVTLSGVVSFPLIASRFIEHGYFKCCNLDSVGGVSFVLFAVHMPIQPILYRMIIPMIALMRIEMEYVVFLSYIVVFVICVVLSFGIYNGVGHNKHLKTLLTGSR